MKMAHTLISILGPLVAFHGYLVCEEQERQERIEGAASKLVDSAEKRGEGGLLPPFVMATSLRDDGVAKVRACAGQLRDPKAKAALSSASAGGSCFVAWGMPVGDPDSERLMDLH